MTVNKPHSLMTLAQSPRFLSERVLAGPFFSEEGRKGWMNFYLISIFTRITTNALRPGVLTPVIRSLRRILFPNYQLSDIFYSALTLATYKCYQILL